MKKIILSICLLLFFTATTSASSNNSDPLNSMRTNTDQFTGITWYVDKNITQDYSWNPPTMFYAYIGKKDGEPPWLMLKINYSGESWLFVNKAYLKTDSKVYDFAVGDRKTAVLSASDVWEYYDVKVDALKYEMLKDIATSKTLALRLEGNQYYQDYNLHISINQCIDRTMKAYEFLGGNTFSQTTQQ